MRTFYYDILLPDGTNITVCKKFTDKEVEDGYPEAEFHYQISRALSDYNTNPEGPTSYDYDYCFDKSYYYEVEGVDLAKEL